MSTPDTLAAHLMPTPESIRQQLVQHLSTCRGYTEPLGVLINNLCARLQLDEPAAPMELWRLVQGLHFGGMFAAAGLERVELQLNVLRPQWRSQ